MLSPIPAIATRPRSVLVTCIPYPSVRAVQIPLRFFASGDSRECGIGSSPKEAAHMRSKLLAIVIGAAISLAAGAWTGAHAAGAKGSAGKYTGCLAKGDGSNEFKLTNVDGGSGEYELIGGKDL